LNVLVHFVGAPAGAAGPRIRALGWGSFCRGRAANEKPRRHPCREPGLSCCPVPILRGWGPRRQSDAVSQPVEASIWPSEFVCGREKGVCRPRRLSSRPHDPAAAAPEGAFQRVSRDSTPAQRCGARTRRGSRCQSPAMTNGRCRMHGGPSPGAPKGNKNAFRHGFYTVDAITRRRQIAELIRSARRLIR